MTQLLDLVAQLSVPSMVGAEVGVCQGDTSAELLRRFPSLILNMIDSWQASPPESAYRRTGDRQARANTTAHLRNLAITLERTGFAFDRRRILRESSLAAAPRFADESLDFVFIDAAHDLESVRQDIAAWWPKVCVGGFLAGHDYGHRRFGVTAAVEELFPGRFEVGSDTVWWVWRGRDGDGGDEELRKST